MTRNAYRPRPLPDDDRALIRRELEQFSEARMLQVIDGGAVPLVSDEPRMMMMSTTSTAPVYTPDPRPGVFSGYQMPDTLEAFEEMKRQLMRAIDEETKRRAAVDKLNHLIKQPDIQIARTREGGPSAVAAAPERQQRVIYCQSQYDPDE